jgi:hypothetical protein
LGAILTSTWPLIRRQVPCLEQPNTEPPSLGLAEKRFEKAVFGNRTRWQPVS